MKAPRYAHWLVAPALALGMVAGPTAHAQAAPASRTAAPEADEEEEGDTAPAEDAPPTETAPKAGAPKAGAPKAGAPKAGAPKDAAPKDAAPKDAAPTEAEPTDAEPIDAEPTDAEPTDTEPTDAAPTDAEPTAPVEPTITVTPRPVSPSPSVTPVVRVAPREVELDPRRRTAGDRILFRGGLLAFGVAGAALVPTVVGLHQAAYAGRVLDRLDTPSEAAERPDVQAYQRSMTRMALITGSATVASAIAGAVLVGLGARRGRPTPPAAVAPAVGPGTAGLVLRGRF